LNNLIQTIFSICYLKAFNYVDSDGEHVITRDTFCEEATKKVLERWLGPLDDWAEEFDSIDMTNKKGDGNVLFRVSLRCQLSAKNKTKVMISPGRDFSGEPGSLAPRKLLKLTGHGTPSSWNFPIGVSTHQPPLPIGEEENSNTFSMVYFQTHSHSLTHSNWKIPIRFFQFLSLHFNKFLWVFILLLNWVLRYI
jgi:hypothetical protein